MLKIELPEVGSHVQAANYLLNQTKIQNQPVEAEFNGTPMTAFRSDSVLLIATRWNYERFLIQIANGVIKVEDVADSRYIERR